MRIPTTIFMLITAFTICTQSGCKNEPLVADEPWSYEGERISSSDFSSMDGRQLVGSFDLTDMSTQEDYEVLLIFDSGMRQGSFLIPNSYTLTVFYKKRDGVWRSELMAEGTRVWGFTVTNQKESAVTMRASVGIIWLDDLSDLESEQARRRAQAPTLSLEINDGIPRAIWQRPNSDLGLRPEELP